jgi:predicted CXXCH cytochrome family protein
MHNSAAGQPMRYDFGADGSKSLLRSATPDSLCLHCHGQTPQGLAPSVALPQGGAPAQEFAGGYFTYGPGFTPVAGLGHVVGAPPAASDPAAYLATTATTLGCLSCHDQHGSPSYRNLKSSPGGRGAPAPLVAEGVRAGQDQASVVYSASNARYLSGFSRWCMDCHDHAQDHYADMVDVTFQSEPDIASLWATTPVSASGVVLPRLRVQTPLVATVPDPSNEMFCLTCHRAHGGPAPKALIYPDPADSSSLCTPCHTPPVPTPSLAPVLLAPKAATR